MFGYRARIHLLLEALTKKQVRLQTAIDRGVLIREKEAKNHVSLARSRRTNTHCKSRFSLSELAFVHIHVHSVVARVKSQCVL